MSTADSEREDNNFKAVREYLENRCRNLLYDILVFKFKNYENLKANEMWERTSGVSKKAFDESREIWKFHFKILCDVFRSGVCDCLIGPPAIGWSSPNEEKVPESCNGVADDILRIWKIWEENIENNAKASISEIKTKEIFSALMDITNRMSKCQALRGIDCEFQTKISLVTDGKEDGQRVEILQVGEHNTIEIHHNPSIRGSVQTDISQEGEKNVIILYFLQDDRKDKSSECVTIVLRSDNPAFFDLTENASSLDIEKINEHPLFKKYNICIKKISKGSLTMMFIIENRDTMERNIQWIFECIWERNETTRICKYHHVHEVKIEGYIYNPSEYCNVLSSQDSVNHSEKDDVLYKAGKFHFHSHLTWTFARSICDVDVLLSDLFYNLSSNDFTTEAHDNIWVLAKGSVILPKDLKFSSMVQDMTDNADENMRNINFHLAQCLPFEIQSIKNAEGSLLVTFKTNTCIKYQKLLAEDCVIFALTQLLSSVNLLSKVKLMRIGIVVDTELMQGQGNQKESSLAIGFHPESKIAEAINSCAFPEILTTVLKKCGNVDAEIPNRLKIKVKLNDGKGPDKMAVAIDIGTTYSGYAFAECYEFEKDPLKIQLPTWDYPGDEPIAAKIPSIILFDKDENFVAFGSEAERKYFELAEKGQHESSYYFHRFKLLLNELANKEQLTRYTNIPDDTNKMFPAAKVFSHAIRFFKDHFIHTSEQKGTIVKKDKIEWILTIPIVWTGAAKDFVIEAAEEAGISEDKLTIISEQEAATLWSRHLQNEQVSSPKETENAELAIMKGALLFSPDPEVSGSCYDKLERHSNQIKPNEHEQPMKESREKDSTYTQSEREKKNLLDIFNVGRINEKALVVAAIDLGTSFSGYGYIIREELQRGSARPYIPAWESPNSGILTPKIPSSLLLNKEKQCIAFGFEAEKMYMDKESDDDDDDDDYYYFPRFMKHFIGTETEMKMIADINGKEIPAVDLLSMAIKYFHDECLNTLKKNKKERNVNSDEIAWAFTVPSHWMDSANVLMQKAALKAGISSNNTVLVLEPEAALAYYSSLAKCTTESGEIEEAFFPGRKYLLLDAGGLRLDLFAYEFLQNGKQMELITRSVTNIGGVNVDTAFKDFLRKLFGDHVLEEYKLMHYSDYMELFLLFEEKKRQFRHGESKMVTIRMPMSLIKECERYFLEDLGTLIEKTDYRNYIKVVRSKLFIDKGFFTGFFEPTCSKIIQHMKTFLDSEKPFKPAKMFMVGGFSESEILQNAVKDAFPQCQVVSVEAGIAVLEGAIRLVGRTSCPEIPEFINPRISKYTFGVDSFRKFHPGVDSPSKKRTISGNDYCINFFSIHVKIGDVLSEDVDVPPMSYIPVHPHQSEVGFRIYQSTSKNPMYIDECGCMVLGELTIPIPTSPCQERYVKCWLEFKEGNILTCTVACPQTKLMQSISAKWN